MAYSYYKIKIKCSETTIFSWSGLRSCDMQHS
jgi:hypothetical protein